MNKNLYAVKLGPDWIEFRTGKRPLPVSSRFKKTYDARKYNYDLSKWIFSPKTYTVRILSHVGGERVGAMKIDHFQNAMSNAGEAWPTWRRGVAKLPVTIFGKLENKSWRAQFHVKP